MPLPTTDKIQEALVQVDEVLAIQDKDRDDQLKKARTALKDNPYLDLLGIANYGTDKEKSVTEAQLKTVQGTLSDLSQVQEDLNKVVALSSTEEFNFTEKQLKFYGGLGSAIRENLKYCGKNDAPSVAADAVIAHMTEAELFTDKDTADKDTGGKSTSSGKFKIKLNGQEKSQLHFAIATVYNSSTFSNVLWSLAKKGPKFAVGLGLTAAVIAVAGVSIVSAAPAIPLVLQTIPTLTSVAGIQTAATAVMTGAAGIPAIVSGAFASSAGVGMTAATIANTVGSFAGTTAVAALGAKMGYKAFAKVTDLFTGHTFAIKSTEITRLVKEAINKKLREKDSEVEAARTEAVKTYQDKEKEKEKITSQSKE